jgi:hypothetical protein
MLAGRTESRLRRRSARAYHGAAESKRLDYAAVPHYPQDGWVRLGSVPNSFQRAQVDALLGLASEDEG